LTGLAFLATEFLIGNREYSPHFSDSSRIISINRFIVISLHLVGSLRPQMKISIQEIVSDTSSVGNIRKSVEQADPYLSPSILCFSLLYSSADKL
jgi:hypothetical protein